MKILGSGAEAVIYRDENGDVVKERISKAYRIPQIDEKLRGARTRREAKVLQKLGAAKVPVPILKNMDDKNMKITMAFVNGRKVRDIIHDSPASLSKEIGKKIGLLHAQDIIHSDLTTSNMIFDNEVHLIDFGLSFFSAKVEDKAVDLHLFRQALESKHHEIWQECFASAIEGYKSSYGSASEVISRLDTVEKRGRNKIK